jgi:hypothetical protein
MFDVLLIKVINIYEYLKSLIYNFFVSTKLLINYIDFMYFWVFAMFFFCFIFFFFFFFKFFRLDSFIDSIRLVLFFVEIFMVFFYFLFALIGFKFITKDKSCDDEFVFVTGQ